VRVVLGLVLLAAAVVLLAPAALLDRPLALRTGQRLHLADASGFWWRGNGLVATSDGAVRVPLAWRIAFAPLLTGALVVELRPPHDAAVPTGVVALRDGSIDARELHLRVPAALVAGLVPALQAVALRGDVDVDAPSFIWRNGRVSGTLNATWQRAGAAMPGFVVDLGRVSLSGAPSAAGVAGTVSNTGGDVAVDGSLEARADGIDVSLALTPTGRASDALRTALPLLGSPDRAGGVRIAWRSGRR